MIVTSRIATSISSSWQKVIVTWINSPDGEGCGKMWISWVEGEEKNKTRIGIEAA